MKKTASEHRIVRAAVAFPAVVALAAASYVVHGSIVAAVFLYDEIWRRHAHTSARHSLKN
jgi:hypothetical protein